uniref:Alternative protein TFAM n=1 Tax=Homo sapiens TaxID=9606 RepID=L8ECA1_HUMAN|nr:alternative protein TFAM [Homo sapiens]
MCQIYAYYFMLHRIKFLIFNFTFPKYILRRNICSIAFPFF